MSTKPAKLTIKQYDMIEKIPRKFERHKIFTSAA